MLEKLFLILNRVETTGFLMIFVVFVNFVCKNYYYFLPIELFLVFIIMSVLYVGLIFVLKLTKKSYNTILMTLSIIVALSYHYYFSQNFLNNVFYFYVYTFLFFIFVLVLLKNNKIKFLNIFLIFSLILCLFPYFKILKNDIWVNNKLIRIYNSNTEFEGVNFKHKPNIYYFHLESYTGNIGLEQIFNYDNKNFLEDLDSRGFYTWKNSYSNYDQTQMSLYSIFTMKNHYMLIDAFKSIKAQNVTMGNKYNTLVKVLAENGYDINYYFYPTQFVPPIKGYAKFVKLPKITLLRVKNLLLQRPTDMSDPNFPYDMTYNANVLRKDLDKNFKLNKPQFYFIKFSKIRHYHKGFDFKPNFKQNYLSNLEVTNKEILRMVDYIEKNDPNAIIVLMGDHGCKIYDPVLGEIKGDSNYMKSISQYNILLSIKNPYENIKNRPKILSSVNVFRYIISSLTNGYEYNKHKKEDVSFGDSKKIYVYDGKVFENPLDFKVKDRI